MSRPSPLRLLVAAAIIGVVAYKAIGWLRGPADIETNPVGTGSIEGLAVNDLGQPIGGARLWLATREQSDGARGGWSVTADGQGRFTFPQLPAASFTLQAHAVDHIRTNFTAVKAAWTNTPIDLADGARLRELRVVVRRASALSGTVYGPDGKPLAGHSVRGERIGGGMAVGSGVVLTTTDTGGRYYLKELEDGEYIIGVRRPQDASFRLFYPDAVNISGAKRVPVAPGEKQTGVDLHAPQPPAGTIVGALEPVDASPLPPVEVEMFDLDADPALGDRHGRTVMTDSNGFFAFPAVPAGRYLLIAQVTVQPAAPRHYSGTVTVKSDGAQPERAKLPFTRGVQVSGRAARVAGPAAGVTLRVAGVDRDSNRRLGSFVVSALTGGDGGFVLNDVPPGRYTLIATGEDMVVAVDSAAGQGGVIDVADGDVSGITVQAVRRSGQIAGTVRDSAGNITGTGVVVAILAGPAAASAPPPMRSHVAQPSTSGRFVFERLPPGEFDLVTLPELVPAALADPKTLERLRSLATHVVLTDGERKTIDLTIK